MRGTVRNVMEVQRVVGFPPCMLGSVMEQRDGRRSGRRGSRSTDVEAVPEGLFLVGTQGPSQLESFLSGDNRCPTETCSGCFFSQLRRRSSALAKRLSAVASVSISGLLINCSEPQFLHL